MSKNSEHIWQELEDSIQILGDELDIKNELMDNLQREIEKMSKN